MFLIRKSKIILFGLGVILMISILFIPNLKVEYNFEDFLVENDTELDFYKELSTEFNSDNNILLVGIKNKKSIFQSGFLTELEHFTKSCNNLENIANAYSIVTLNDYVRSPFGLINIPYIHVNKPSRYAADSIRIDKDERLKGWLISKDSKTVSVIINTKDKLRENQKENLITELDELISKYSFNEVHIAGNINTEIRYKRLIGKELSLNMLLCSLVVVICLFLSFRSIQGVIIPAITVVSAMLIFYGGLGAFNRHFNILSTLFPTILLIVGISDLIHLFMKYNFSLKKYKLKNDAIRFTIKELALTLFITSLTTAIGFFSLYTAAIKPIRDFGIEAGIGVLLAYMITILFIPAILVRTNPKNFYFKKNELINWSSLLKKIFQISQKNTKEVVLISIVIILISVIGIFQIDTNNYITGNFSNKSGIKKDFVFFENNLSGVRSFKMAIIPQNGKFINDLDILMEIEKLQAYLTSIPEFGIVFSPVTTYKTLNKIYDKSSSMDYILPESQGIINLYEKSYVRIIGNKQLDFINSQKNKGLIIGKINDIGSENVALLIRKIDSWIAKNINTTIVKFKHTGIWYLADKSNTFLVRNMLISLAIAFILVGLLMSLFFKTLKLLIISLVPNLLPLIVAGGIMGFSGMAFNASTAIVFTVGFVIAVDDTIHFLSKFKIECKNMVDCKNAIWNTINETGKAIILTTIILFFGFFVLLHSDLKGVFSQGVLICSMLIAALFGDLFIMPILLNRFYRK